MAEKSNQPGIRHQDTSQHDMMALVELASTGETSKAPTQTQIGTHLRNQQWTQYLEEQLVRNRASNKIAFLASMVKNAMTDQTTKERKTIATKVTQFFVTNMCRLPPGKEDTGSAPVDQTYSIPLINEQMTAAGTEIESVNEWISTNATAQQWIKGVTAGLAEAGASPPPTKDTRKYKRGSQTSLRPQLTSLITTQVSPPRTQKRLQVNSRVTQTHRPLLVSTYQRAIQ